jgi:hypothetical protein
MIDAFTGGIIVRAALRFERYQQLLAGLLKKEKKKHKEYILGYINPRIIGFKNSKLTVDKILDPKDIPDAPKLLDGFYKGEAIIPTDGGK